MKYTVITGASSGIGYEAALEFAKRGKHLIIIARRQDKLEELKTAVKDINAEADVVIYTADLATAENAYTLYEDLKKYEIETWINNAGFGNFASVGEQDLNKIGKMLHLNIEALTILSSLYVRDYENVEGAQLLNISSAGGYNIVPNAVTYCATKFYVSAFTEGLGQELQGKGAKMQAKVLAPAATETEFADRARGTKGFDYRGNVPQYHTAKEMAGFLLNLYDGDKIVGIVDGQTYKFELRNPIFSYAGKR
ncbi:MULTISPECIES: SDR family NAD(P)-dependent oxidoreductase [Bacillaceae]|uniref:SDR family NAD(P)-dependent oxidoreductase n=1 Tax=Bacillaceae TaxID=186817 RepID=UPI001049B986|nr:SDR family NAD(P)-dependent oxidoreductase [Bacillus sp. CBEL-1]TDB49725.1 SDR family NAD(P)-dependent oxidoreductase [Bacillus sp. CBEL-1]